MSEKVTELTNAMISNFLPGVFIPKVKTHASVDDFTETGFYYVGATSESVVTGQPGNPHGILMVLNDSVRNFRTVQIYVSDAGEMYVRIRVNQSWRPWKIVTSTTLST